MSVSFALEVWIWLKGSYNNHTIACALYFNIYTALCKKFLLVFVKDLENRVVYHPIWDHL
jgi:hypothetical protein